MASEWAESTDPEVAALARLVVDVGRVHPRKRKRLPYIRSRDPELWERMVAAGLADEWFESSEWGQESAGDRLDEEPAGLSSHRAFPVENVDPEPPAREEYDEDELPF
jgi:hypothetical protein